MESIFDSILNSKDATERKREIEDKQLEENDKRNRLNEEYSFSQMWFNR